MCAIKYSPIKTGPSLNKPDDKTKAAPATAQPETGPDRKSDKIGPENEP